VDFRPWDAQEPSGTITVEHESDGPVLHLCGDVDGPVVERWETERPADGPEIVAVDVSRMAYIDSTGLSFLVRWARDQSNAGRPAVIRNAGPRFEQVLAVTGLGSMFVRDG
jgi:anti-anti-sigma factor